MAQEFAKKGVPLSYRAKLWAQILNVIVEDVVSSLLKVFFHDSSKVNEEFTFVNFIVVEGQTSGKSILHAVVGTLSQNNRIHSAGDENQNS